MPTADAKLPEVKLQRSNERDCAVSLLSVAATHPATHPATKPMAHRGAPEPEEVFLSSEALMPGPKKEAETPFTDSETALVRRRAAYARLSVESLNAVC